MTVQDIQAFESIKKKIEILKDKRAKAEGAMETIKDSWQKRFGFCSIEEAQTHYNEMEDTLTKDTAKLDSYMEELKSLTNWNTV